MVIDINYDFRRDAKGGDPDSRSQTLRHYHKILWSKLLPNGKDFKLVGGRNRIYLHHRSELGAFFLGSDSITHSYKNHVRKQWIIRQIPDEVNELCNAGCTIGAYIIFPNNRVNNRITINGARGCHVKIDDRFDLTLECIRRFYVELDSPLYHTILRYKNFFDLFGDFRGYVDFFLLQDLIDERGQIKFYLPFDNFAKPPAFCGVDDYLFYKKGVMDFIGKRNERIRKSLAGYAGAINPLLFAARV